MFLSSFMYSSVRYCTVPNSTVQLQLRYRTVPVPVGTVWYGKVPVRAPVRYLLVKYRNGGTLPYLYRKFTQLWITGESILHITDVAMFLSSFRYSSVRYCTVPNSTVQLQLRYRTVPVPVGTVWYGTVPVRVPLRYLSVKYRYSGILPYLYRKFTQLWITG